MDYAALGVAIITILFVAIHFNQIERTGKFCYVTIILATFANALDYILVMKILACVCMMYICYEMYKNREYKIEEHKEE